MEQNSILRSVARCTVYNAILLNRFLLNSLRNNRLFSIQMEGMGFQMAFRSLAIPRISPRSSECQIPRQMDVPPARRAEP